MTVIHAVLTTPIPHTDLGVYLQGEQCIVSIDLICRRQSQKKHPKNQLLSRLKQQLAAYFAGTLHHFNLPCSVSGTPHQQRVWRALQGMPFGTRHTYGSLAKRLDTSPRAIGNACRQNPLPLIIPCHRVVGKTSTGGFMGATSGNAIHIKQWLLQHEQRTVH